MAVTNTLKDAGDVNMEFKLESGHYFHESASLQNRLAKCTLCKCASSVH